jgi:hypothetical protein
MSYRPHGRAEISERQPRALGVCDRCGFLYNHCRIMWQYDWRGPRMQNERILVCDSCYDKPQQNGQRTIILPADPIPIQNARPEYYVPDNNPLSGLGANPDPLRWQLGAQIGTLVHNAGVPSAFNGTVNKPSQQCAAIVRSVSSFGNYVGINWSEGFGLNPASSLSSPVRTHSLSSYTNTAPNDAAIGSTGYVVQGSPVAAGWGSWTTIASGNIQGTPGEVLSGTPSGGRYQFHRVAFWGNGGQITVAQVSLSVNEGSSR